MSWVRLDDNFSQHPKVLQLTPEAGWLYVLGLCYVSRLSTDGVVADSGLSFFASRWTRPKQIKLVTELLKAGLWELADEPVGAYLIHDYLLYNPSRERREELSEKRAAAGKKSGEQRRLKLINE